MKGDNIIVDKSFQFGLRIVKLFLHLKQKKVERDLCSHLLRSGTSIGENIEEAVEVHPVKILFISSRLLTERHVKQDISYGY